MTYLVRVPPHIENQITGFHPLLKKRVRAAFDLLAQDPYQGKTLKDELTGLHSFRVARYRIVYRIKKKLIQIEVVGVGVGHRKKIY